MHCIAGYSTGIVIKQQKDRQEYIDDFYASHPDTPRPLSRYGSVMNQDGSGVGAAGAGNGAGLGGGGSADYSKRAQSLPDVLCCDAEKFRARGGDRGRSMSVRTNQQQQTAKAGGMLATSPKMPR